MLGTNIYNLRKANSMNQEELATELNVSRQAISKWERDESTPDLEKLAMLAKLFNVTIDELLGDEYNMSDYKPNTNSFFEMIDQENIKLIALGTLIISLISSIITFISFGTAWFALSNGITPTFTGNILSQSFSMNVILFMSILFIIEVILFSLSIVIYQLYQKDHINKKVRIFIIIVGVTRVLFGHTIIGLLYVFLGIITPHHTKEVKKNTYIGTVALIGSISFILLILFWSTAHGMELM